MRNKSTRGYAERVLSSIARTKYGWMAAEKARLPKAIGKGRMSKINSKQEYCVCLQEFCGHLCNDARCAVCASVATLLVNGHLGLLRGNGGREGEEGVHCELKVESEVVSREKRSQATSSSDAVKRSNLGS